MEHIKRFLTGIDKAWPPRQNEPLLLQMVGSAALMLQTDYARGTKDGDILESRDISVEVSKRLKELGGEGSELHTASGMYIDVVNPAILFLPQSPTFTAIDLPGLKNFRVAALEINAVVVSKLKPFRPTDLDDIKALADRDLLNHERIIEIFKGAADWFSIDARAAKVPQYLKNLHKVEQDILGLSPTAVDLPQECERE